MPAAAVAGWIRGRALLQRRIGPEGAQRVAGAGSLLAATTMLAETPYGHSVRPGVDLDAAQRSVRVTLLWNLRILAGWQPPGQAASIRVLAGGFEIANIIDHLLTMYGGSRPQPFDLGSLSTAWPAVRVAAHPDAVRSALARSDWGDPGDCDPGAVLTHLRIAWARRVFGEVEPAALWAQSAMVLMTEDIANGGAGDIADGGAGDIAQAGSGPILGRRSQRDVDRVLGRRGPEVPGRRARSGPGAGRVPAPRPAPGDSRDRVADPQRWNEWWRAMASGARSLAAGPRPGPACTVGVVGLLAADARRAAAALGVVGAPAAVGREVLDAVA